MAGAYKKPAAAKKSTPKPTPKPKVTPKAKLTGDAAIKEYQRQISPKGMASASAAASKALDEKYPNLYKSATPKPKKKK